MESREIQQRKRCEHIIILLKTGTAMGIFIECVGIYWAGLRGALTFHKFY